MRSLFKNLLLIATGLHVGDGMEIASDATFKSLATSLFAIWARVISEIGAWRHSIVDIEYQIPGWWACGRLLT